MSLSRSTFETVVPSRHIIFTFPINHNNHIRIAVLDSPSAAAAAASPSFTAAMCVPPGRESDWIFSTFSGHLQLLLSSTTTTPLSRLILIGNLPSCPRPTTYNSIYHPCSSTSLEQNVAPFLLGLTPKSAFLDGGDITEVPFLIYEDEVLRSSVLEICEGPCVGEMLVENVELEGDGVREFRRWLRFKRMPNFVQSQMRIHPRDDLILENLDKMEFELDKGVLVQPYLSPMVAGISVISGVFDRRMAKGLRSKVLCLGVGGGALLGFLSNRLNFEVVGVEEDEVVLEVGKRYFGLESDDLITLIAEDGIKYVKRIAKSISEENLFHVVMVDLDSNDAVVGVCAPPMEFVKKSVLQATRDVLCKEGVLIVNVIPSSKLSYEALICEFQEVFEELYEIDVGNGENFVLIATKSMVADVSDGSKSAFLDKLNSVVSTSYVDSTKKLSKTDDTTSCK